MTNNDAKGASQKIAAACSSGLFGAFSVVYLYFFQADMLAVAQHILSQGATTYNPLVGAVLITLILMLVQVVVARVVKLRGGAFALTFFPSSLLLAWLGGITPATPHDVTFAIGPLAALCGMALWGSVCWVLTRMQSIGVRSEPGLFFTATMWRNVMLIVAQMAFVGLAANSDITQHYRMRAEACLYRGDVEGALNVGRHSLHTCEALTMLRAHALALKGRMGDELFRYAVQGTGNDLAPMPGHTECLLYPNDSIYRLLGARPARAMTAETYFAALRHDSLATRMVADYELCMCLIDRRLDDFAKLLPEYYTINDSLPRHYREALTLYTHLRATPAIVYSEQAMETDYDDFRSIQHSESTPMARKNALRPHYQGTYWWYYEYE